MMEMMIIVLFLIKIQSPLSIEIVEKQRNQQNTTKISLLFITAFSYKQPNCQKHGYLINKKIIILHSYL